MSTSNKSEQTYRIGAVARLTGIQPETLRIWERRYGVVAPPRSAGGGREYSENDVTRLRLIKQLVNSGDAISSVAGLDGEALSARTLLSKSTMSPQHGRREPTRVVVIGDTLAEHMTAAADRLEGIELLAFGRTAESVLPLPTSPVVDVMVIETSTLHAETTREIIHWLDESQARQALVVYRFAAAEALQRLPASRIQTVQAPVTPVVVRNLCTGMASTRVLAMHESPSENQATELSIHPRTYSNAMLSRLALASPTIKCECPKHLTELITDLVAFEQYSMECENRNLDDASMHAYLHAITSKARNMMEEALTRVLEYEGIDLEDPGISDPG